MYHAALFDYLDYLCNIFGSFISHTNIIEILYNSFYDVRCATVTQSYIRELSFISCYQLMLFACELGSFLYCVGCWFSHVTEKIRKLSTHNWFCPLSLMCLPRSFMVIFCLCVISYFCSYIEPFFCSVPHRGQDTRTLAGFLHDILFDLLIFAYNFRTTKTPMTKSPHTNRHRFGLHCRSYSSFLDLCRVFRL